MYYVYILRNPAGKYYVGYSKDVEERLKKHNGGGSVWTKNHRPWDIIYTEEYETRTEALKREKEIKSYKGGNKFRELISKIC